MKKIIHVELPKIVIEKLDQYGYNYEKNFVTQCFDVCIGIMLEEEKIKED